MIPKRIAPDGFAAALAVRLNSVVPNTLSVRAEGSAVAVYDPSWWGTSLIGDNLADEDGRSIIERLETVAQAVMSSIQDVVMRSTKEQWPMGPTGVGLPEARVEHDQLHMWFGDKAAPVLRLEPIDLSSLPHGAA